MFYLDTCNSTRTMIPITWQHTFSWCFQLHDNRYFLLILLITWQNVLSLDASNYMTTDTFSWCFQLHDKNILSLDASNYMTKHTFSWCFQLHDKAYFLLMLSITWQQTYFILMLPITWQQTYFLIMLPITWQQILSLNASNYMTKHTFSWCFQLHDKTYFLSMLSIAWQIYFVLMFPIAI